MKHEQSEAGKERYPNRSIPLPYLRGLRRSRGLSQKNLGRLAKVSLGTDYRLQAGLRGAYPGTVRKLATALGVAPEALVHGTSSVGTPLSYRNVVRSFKALLKRTGLPPSVRLYDLHHTCATLPLSRNVHPKYVQELLGHASISQTLDTYSHVIEGMDGGVTEAIDEALG